MRTTSLCIVVLLMAACQTTTTNITTCAVEGQNQQLTEWYAQDQAVRDTFMAVLAQQQAGEVEQSVLIKTMSRMQTVDERNVMRLTNLLDDCGWQAGLADTAHKAIFMILQHAPDSIMRHYFPQVEEKAALGLVDSSDWAMMHDRLAMRAGIPQRFGTQTYANEEDVNMVWPVENADSVDHWRAAVGLPRMSDYFQLSKEAYDIVMVWDTSLTVEEANR